MFIKSTAMTALAQVSIYDTHKIKSDSMPSKSCRKKAIMMYQY